MVNKAQKEAIQAQLKAEQKTLRELKQVYNQARKDCEKKIAQLNARKNFEPENLQTIIYQERYQKALQKQIDAALRNLDTKQYDTIADFIQDSYANGYTGVMYDLQKQGIPLTIPIDQKQVAKAVQIDSKISKGMYTRLGEDVTRLKNSIRAEVSRGIATGSSWIDIADKIARGMNSPFDVALNNSIRIARTEGHRVQQSAALDAQKAAKEAGADIVKQWDAALDQRTRPAHAEADGQIREVDEPFDVGGEKLMKPGDGSAANAINCRCCILQRAKWALTEEELQTLKDRANFYGLDKSKSFEDYKAKYLNFSDNHKSTDLTERRKQRLAERSKKKEFVPAKDVKEVKSRISQALGVDESKINLGRMKLELANEYLDGVETFMEDFPQMRGLYTAINTRRCGGGTLGINALEGKGRYVGKDIVYDMVLELGFKSPRDLDDLRAMYAYGILSGQQFKGASPKATAIHELAHGLTYAIQMKKNGYFTNGVLQTVVPKKEWGKYSSTGTFGMVNKVKDELYGIRHGSEVFDGMKHLGSYGLTNADETVAQSVAYEYINSSESKPFSAKILEELKKEAGEAFK